MNIEEGYSPVALAASGVVGTSGASVIVNQFICSVTGTLQLRNTNAGGSIALASMPVTAGGVYPLKMNFGAGCWADLTTATGTFCIR